MANALEDMLQEAEDAVLNAQLVRNHYARKRGRSQAERAHAITAALERLKTAMRPLRTEIGRFPYGAQTDVAERNRQRVRDASDAIQRERRKLWKMQRSTRASVL